MRTEDSRCMLVLHHITTAISQSSHRTGLSGNTIRKDDDREHRYATGLCGPRGPRDPNPPCLTSDISNSATGTARDACLAVRKAPVDRRDDSQIDIGRNPVVIAFRGSLISPSADPACPGLRLRMCLKGRETGEMRRTQSKMISPPLDSRACKLLPPAPGKKMAYQGWPRGSDKSS